MLLCVFLKPLHYSAVTILCSLVDHPTERLDCAVLCSAWQEVLQQQEQRQEEAHGAVHYKEASPSPLVDGEYCSFSSYSSSSNNNTFLWFADVLAAQFPSSSALQA